MADAALGRGDRLRAASARQRGQPPRRAAASSPSPTGWAGTAPARSPARSPSTCCGPGLSAPGADLDDVVGGDRRGQRRHLPRRHRQPRPAGHGHHGHRARRDRRRRRADDRRDADDRASDATPTSSRVDPEQLALVNVGDSRTYLLRHGRLRRVTVDHSYVQELVATGHITDDEARTHPRRNIVTRALGIDPAVRVDAWTLPLVRGDRFLLCSDGLVDEVRDDEIVERPRRRSSDPQAAADELVALANRQGGRDNITVIVVDVLEGAEPPDPDTELDLEPAWERRRRPGTWAVDDPRRPRPTEFDDLAALVSGDGRRRRRRRRRPTPTPADHRRGARRRGRAADAAAGAGAVGSASSAARRARRARAGVRHRRGVGPARLLRRLRRRRRRRRSTAAGPTASCGSSRPWKRRRPSTAIELDEASIERVEREPAFDSRAGRRALRRRAARDDDHHDDDHDHDDHDDHDHDDDRRRPTTAATAAPMAAHADRATAGAAATDDGRRPPRSPAPGARPSSRSS